MTTPRPTVRELAYWLQTAPPADGDWPTFAADALLGSNLPLDKPYYPEPVVGESVRPKDAMWNPQEGCWQIPIALHPEPPPTSAHPGSPYTWNHQTGEWTVAEIDAAKAEPTPLQPDDLNFLDRMLNKLVFHHDCGTAEFAAVARIKGLLAARSEGPGGVNAVTGLQEGRCSLGDSCQCQAFSQAFRQSCPRWAVSSPPIPTPASTAGAVEELAARFRKRPVVIEAWRWIGPDLGKSPDWIADAICVYGEAREGQVRQVGNTLEIETLEGRHTAQLGDWIICGVKGELYPCKPDIFAMTYEPASEDDLPLPASATIARLKAALEDARDGLLAASNALHNKRTRYCAEAEAASGRAAQALADLAGEG